MALFPLTQSGRKILDGNGNPFLLWGRALWGIMGLPHTDYATIFNDSTAKGFNAIECFVPAHHDRSQNPPFDFAGNLPFSKRLDGGTWSGTLVYGNANNEAPDFTTPVEAYWANVDYLVQYCADNGYLVLLFPAYCGFNGGDQGWMVEMVANGQTKMQTYGAFVAARYASATNIVWMLGGDFSPSTTAQKNAETGLINGLTTVTPRFYAAEWNDGQNGEDNPDFNGTITWNSVYTFDGTQCASHSRNAYNSPGTEPAFLLEEPYDESGPDGTNINSTGAQPIRRYLWWGWLGTIGGVVAGNENVWPFNPSTPWQNHINTQTAQDTGRIATLLRSLDWSNFVPQGLAGMATIITAGGSTSTSSDYVAAAAHSAGSGVLAYVPPAHSGTITVNMAVMAGSTRARWWNPSTAAFTAIASGLANSGTHVFTPPGDNGTGFTDWVLVLDLGSNDLSGTITLADDVVSGSATTENQLSGTITLADDVVSGSTTVENQLSGTITLADDTASGSATVENQLSGTIALADDVVSGSAAVGNQLSGTIVLADDTASGSAVVENQLSGTIALADDAVSGSATTDNQLSGTIVLADDVAHGIAVTGGLLSGTIVLGDDVALGQAVIGNAASGFIVLDDDVVLGFVELAPVALLTEVEQPSARRLAFGPSGVLLPDGPEFPAVRAAPDIAGLPWRRDAGKEWTLPEQRRTVLDAIIALFAVDQSLVGWSVTELDHSPKMSALRLSAPYLVFRVERRGGRVVEVTGSFPHDARWQLAEFRVVLGDVMRSIRQQLGIV